jgi:N-acetyl-anhydromuramyl-L-alanine amidase AmpD
MSPTLAERGKILRPFKVIAKMADPQDFGSRKNTPVDCLVLHTTEGTTADGALAWWKREDVVASAHYLIDEDFRIIQNVAEGDAAFHAGNGSVNRRSIGIEVVGHAGESDLWSPEVMAPLVMLAADICKRHKIPILHQPGPGICGHADVPDPYSPNLRGGASHHHDPGQFFPWGDFFDSLRAELAEGA